MDVHALPYRCVWCIDFEFSAPPGERPSVVCLAGHELKSGHTIRHWRDELARMSTPPYSVGEDSLLIAYYASAEVNCHLALGWPEPQNLLDLYVEFRNLTNGIPLEHGANLIGALLYFGLPSFGSEEKEGMRELAMRGGPWSEKERRDLLDYCESDVVALERLLYPMLPRIDQPRAVLRGRYMTAAARIEHRGVPIDGPALRELRRMWASIQARLIDRVDASFGVFEEGSFKRERFERYLEEHRMPWPRLESGALKLDTETFREMARVFPVISSLHELRTTLSRMRLEDLAVGSDSRNRCMLSAFRAKTGRNQPGNAKFIFGPAKWLRSLIKPPIGFGIAYIDWEQQEFGIAAKLSGDRAMMAAYQSGDPYLTFGKQCGVLPGDATKESHRAERELFKQCTLAVQYGMGPKNFAQRIDRPVHEAERLLRLHRETYRDFWQWSDGVVDYAMLRLSLHTAFGWTLHLGLKPNDRSLRNFPMQANGAEMLRLACALATERGVGVCAPVHDAILIEASLGELHETIEAARNAMAEASAIVLDGFELRTDVLIVRYPDRYRDERGGEMWDTVWEIIREIEDDAA